MRIWRARWSLEFQKGSQLWLEVSQVGDSPLEGQMRIWRAGWSQMRIWRARWSLEFPKCSQLPLELSQVRNSPLEGQMRICSARCSLELPNGANYRQRSLS
jgi:hypothetical protein